MILDVYWQGTGKGLSLWGITCGVFHAHHASLEHQYHEIIGGGSVFTHVIILA